MKIFLYSKLIIMTFYSIVFNLVCVGSILASTAGSGQSVEELELDLNERTCTLKEFFDLTEQQSSYRYFYIEGEFNTKDEVTISPTSINYKEMLQEIANQEMLHFTVVNNIVVVKKEKSTAPNVIIQEKKGQAISGKVLDEEGKPLPGVSVVVKGTSFGVITNVNGEYTLKVPEEADVLVFSFIGKKTQLISINGRVKVNVKMIEETFGLDEVVAIGYGIQSEVKVTGAISKVKSDDLNKYASTSFEHQLAGKVPGVQINELSGQPGSDAQIIVRGTGTLTAGTDPLIVVDGMPLTEGSSLSSVNAQDIESVEVLRDAASSAIYGSRASNGVILITTKNGSDRSPKIQFNYSVGLQQRSDNVEFVGAYDAATYFTEARDWGYVSDDPVKNSIDDGRETRLANGASKRQLRLNYIDPYLEGENGLTDTDWLDEVFRNAQVSNYGLAFSGGNKKSDYYISGSYLSQDGIVIETDFKRYSSSIKFNTELNKRMDFSISINPSYSIKHDFPSGWSYDPVGAASIMYPFFSPYDEDGTLAISEQIEANTYEDGALGENPVAIAKMTEDRTNSFRTFGSAFLNIEILKGLKFKTSLGADYRNYIETYYNPSNLGAYRSAAPKSAIAEESTKIVTNYITENTLNYIKSFGDHAFNLLAGYTFQKENSTYSYIEGSDIADDLLENISGASSHSVSSSKYIWTQISYLARLQYSYRTKYLFSAAIRKDGSSRFGDNSKWATFPSLSAGWVLNNEDFFPDTKIINLAKLRASWGQTGNNQVGAYSSKAILTSTDYAFDNSLASGFAASSSPNANLSWETTTSLNVGFDLGLWTKIKLSGEYYHSITSDLLLDVPVPEQSGYDESLQNIGKVKNTGVEVSISGNNIDLGQVKWNFGANIFTNKNEVLELGEGQEQIIDGTASSSLTKVGGPISALYGYNIIGVYKTDEEIESTPCLDGTLTGDYIVEDRDEDENIDTDDKTTFGTNNPDFTYGFNSSFSYKNFELDFALYGVEGRKLFNKELAYITEVGEGFGVPSQYYFDNRYHPDDNPDGFFARPNMGSFSSARKNTRASSIYFQDADYLRLRYITIAYNFPQSIASKIKASKARVYLTANNLFTITEYRGYNPDSSSSSDPLNYGQTGYGGYPIARSFIFGVNLTF